MFLVAKKFTENKREILLTLMPAVRRKPTNERPPKQPLPPNKQGVKKLRQPTLRSPKKKNPPL